jgi:gliding motility-associated-like protein
VTRLVFVFIIVLSSLCLPGIAQTNLVPNPGFEENYSYHNCINNPADSIQWPLFWVIPYGSGGTPDYVHNPNCDSLRRIPCNFVGCQEAYEGNAYMVICTVSDTSNEYREYVQTSLIQELIAGNRYCLSVWVSMNDSSLRATDDFGIFFSDTAIYGNGNYNIPVVPQVRNPDGRFLSDKDKWMLVSGSFMAIGGEKYITIGNFLDDLHSTWIDVPPCMQYACDGGGHYIDMVSLFDCTGFNYNANAGEDVTVCRGDSVTLGTDDFPDRKYTWSPATGLNDSAKARPSAAPIRTTTYLLSVIDEYIQQTYDTITVTVDTTCGAPLIYIPNVFSPNNDGSNDLLFMRGTSIKDVDFKIYDRWGNLVFESFDISVGWAGSYNGRECPEGVYFYLAEIKFIDDLVVVKKGSITLTR